MGFTILDGKIAEIDAIADPERVRRIAEDGRMHNPATDPLPWTSERERLVIQAAQDDCHPLTRCA